MTEPAPHIERVNYSLQCLTWVFEDGVTATIRKCCWREGKPYSLALFGSCASITLDDMNGIWSRHAELCASEWVEPESLDNEPEYDIVVLQAGYKHGKRNQRNDP